MTQEDVKKLQPGDKIIITTPEGIGQATVGTILTVTCVDEDGHINIGGGIFLTDPRRVDLYRRAKKPDPPL